MEFEEDLPHPVPLRGWGLPESLAEVSWSPVLIGLVDARQIWF